MKEAIKVQSVTIIVINGISEAFEVHVGSTGGGRDLCFRSRLPVGEDEGKNLCVAERR